MLEREPIQVPAWIATPLDILERRATLLFLLLSVLYFAVTVLIARTRLPWNDELFTWYIAQRPSLAEVWNALLTGAEQLPPLFYVITRASAAMFGMNAVSLRLPEILGFWVMSASLFWFVRSRTSAPYGLIAMLFPMATDALFYAYEARPYGLMLAFSGLALLCWERAISGHSPALWRASLAVCLAAAISCHYFGLLSFVPFVLAECTRTARRRQIDISMWAALCSGLVPLLFFVPLLRAARAYSHAFWSQAHWSMGVLIYRELLAPAALLLFIVPILLAIYLGTRSGEHPSARRHVWPVLRVEDVSVMVGFLCIPVVGVVLAKTALGAFNYRYAMAAVLGLSLAFAYSVLVLAQRSARAALITVTALAVFFVMRGISDYRHVAQAKQDRVALYASLRSRVSSRLPLVIAAPHMFFELSHEAAQARDNAPFVFLADVPLATRYTGTDDVELGLLTMKEWAPLDVRDFRQFCASNNDFLLFGHSEPFSWVDSELLKEGWSFTVVAQIEDSFLFRVTRSNNKPLASISPAASRNSIAIPVLLHHGVIAAAMKGSLNSHT